MVESVSLAEEPLDADLLALYRAEHARAGIAPDPAMAAPDYGTFLHRHMRPLVLERFLPKEWPPEMAAQARRMTLWDLGLLMAGTALEAKAAESGVDAPWMQARPLLDLVVDWYSLRQSPAQAPTYIPPENLHAYRFLAKAYGDRQADPHTPRGFFALFLGVLATSLERMVQSLPA